MPAPTVLDLSHHQPTLDWPAIAGSGIQGIIHKCTEGSSYADPTYASRMGTCPMLWGAYHFLRPGNMLQQANFFLEHAQPDDNMLLAADHEDPRVSIDDLKTFLAAVAAMAGRFPVLYSGYIIKEQIATTGDEELSLYRLWLAQYTAGTPTWPTATWPQWWLWQYTGKGQVPGIHVPVDCDAYQGADLAGEWSGRIDP